MARRGTAIPLSHRQAQSKWLDEQLIIISRNLLERPLDCRGPFVIHDRELGLQVTRCPKGGSD